MTTYLIDGSTELPESGDTGWGTTLNAAILSIDSRFTWSDGQATPDAVAASVITGTTLPATLVTSSLTSVGTLSSLTVSGNATIAGLLTSATTFALINTTATTVNFAGAATALNIGAGSGTTTINNALVVTGNLTVNGTTTTVNSTTLTVDDKNIVLADTASPTDVGADGGGITLKGTTDKTLNWVDATDAWTSSEDFNLLTGKVYEINGTTVLSSTTLGSGVTASSLTSVGTIATGTWQGTAISGQYGGTGVANTGKTITLGGNLTTSGAYATTLTATATTSVTLPTTGTLATLAGTETLTNKTLTSPSLTTPTLGVASATTINKVALTAPATGSTLTIADGKTFTASNTLTFTGTDSSSVAFGTGGTVAYTGGTLAQFAATTSSQIAGVISDETGSGSLVFATSPTLVTPNLGTPSALTLTNATGLPISTGVSGLGTGVATFLATPSSANLAAAVTGEAGSGALVFDTSPAITTSITTSSTSFDLINTTATTVNFAKAATTLSIGAVTGTTTVNNVLTLVGSDSKSAIFTTSGGAYAYMNIYPNSVIGSSAITSPYLSIAGGYAQGTAAGAQSVEGGRVDIYGGAAVGSTGSALTYGGDVYIDGGSGTTRPGRVYIGATNTLSLSIGRTGATTTVTGALTATGTTTVTGALTATGTTILGPASIATQATARTLTLADQGKVIDMTNTSDVALTIPPNSSVAFPIGTQILVIRNSTGKVSFTPGAGVTLRSDSSKQFISTQYSAATLMQRAADEWYLIGNLAAS